MKTLCSSVNSSWLDNNKSYYMWHVIFLFVHLLFHDFSILFHFTSVKSFAKRAESSARRRNVASFRRIEGTSFLQQFYWSLLKEAATAAAAGYSPDERWDSTKRSERRSGWVNSLTTPCRVLIPIRQIQPPR